MVGEVDMKTKVRIACDSFHYNVIKGEVGYVDGYMLGDDNVHCAVVVIGKSFKLVPLYMIELYEDKNN